MSFGAVLCQRRGVAGCCLTVATSKMSQVQSSNGKWLRTLRFIAKKIARRNAASAIWRATTDDDEHYVYAIAL